MALFWWLALEKRWLRHRVLRITEKEGKKNMKYRYILLTILMLCTSCTRNKSNGKITSVPFTNVTLNDNFWKTRIEVNQKVTIPHSFKMCENTGRIKNFEVAAGFIEGEFQGIYPFNDSDVYKIIEGTAYTFQTNPNEKLEAYVDSLIDIIAAAQENDGYLMTWRTINPNKAPTRWSGAAERWSDISQGHELYCAGHLYEAATAYYQATGKRKLLDVALKNADLISQEFGPGKIEEPPGHQEIELGLVKLYRVTGNRKYLDLADFFLEQRGRQEYDQNSPDMWKSGKYWQDHIPVTQQDEAVGHAVRATYMYSAMADIAVLKQNDSYRNSLERLWDNVVEKKLYITGGVGAIPHGEAFGPNYELPNLSAYNETCASVGNVFWNHRMFLLYGDSKYIDVMERTMYNGLISGISLDGKLFFYPNVLESKGYDQRSSWFPCACCPGNITRFMASLPDYIYATEPGAVYINLFIENKAEILINDTPVQISQKTNYPWEGEIVIALHPERPQTFNIKIRIPGWARHIPVPGDLYKFVKNSQDKHVITINGQEVSYNLIDGYASIYREWKKYDIIKLNLPMPVKRIITNEKLESNFNKVAVQRGPIIYCAEAADNNGGKISNLVLPDEAKLTSLYHPELLNGISVISGNAIALSYNQSRHQIMEAAQQINLIPYYAWAHRGKGAMAVWLAREKSVSEPFNSPPISTRSRINISSGRNSEALNDEIYPGINKHQVVPYFTLSADSSGTHWVEYKFSFPVELSSASVYWVSDTSTGYKVPNAWKIVYKSNGNWVRVYTEQEYEIKEGEFNMVEFETVRTNSIRLEAIPNQGGLLGIYEWGIE
jgi:DUF1680 family protein